MQAEPRQIRGNHFEVIEAADRVDSDREESLRILVCIFDIFVVGILLLLKRITTNTYRIQCHGNASIICYIHHKDATRKSYHNYYCSDKWGDSRNYDLCINSSNLGVDGVVDIIELLVKRELSSREALL